MMNQMFGKCVDSRVRADGNLVIHGEDIALGRLIDVSPDRLRFRVTEGRMPTVGDSRLDIELRLDGHAGRWLQLGGHVEHVDGSGEVLVGLELARGADADEFAAMVRGQAQSSVDSLREARVLLVDPDDARRLRYAGRLRARGCTVTEVSTALGAIAHLGESCSRPAAIAVADTAPVNIANDLRRYLAEVHPELPVIYTRI